MSTALIGYTGFVGGALDAQASFDDRYHSANIGEIRGRRYDLIVCAGAPATKWKANQDPESDLANLRLLMGHLSEVRAGRFLLVSTVDVYREPRGVDEDTPIDPTLVDPYGRHRYYLEAFARERFEHTFVIRLPGLFGRGLKKNLIYDLLHDNCLDLTHRESLFQFYNTERLWPDLEVVLRRGLPLVNFATEPVRASEVARRGFGREFETVTERPPARYDMRTRFARHFGAEGDYIRSAEQTFEEIRRFVARQRAAQTV